MPSNIHPLVRTSKWSRPIISNNLVPGEAYNNNGRENIIITRKLGTALPRRALLECTTLFLLINLLLAVDLNILEASMPLILINVSGKGLQSNSSITSIRPLKKLFSVNLDSDPTAFFFLNLRVANQQKHQLWRQNL